MIIVQKAAIKAVESRSAVIDPPTAEWGGVSAAPSAFCHSATSTRSK
jgi:hypothetical protein